MFSEDDTHHKKGEHVERDVNQPPLQYIDHPESGGTYQQVNADTSITQHSKSFFRAKQVRYYQPLSRSFPQNYMKQDRQGDILPWRYSIQGQPVFRNDHFRLVITENALRKIFDHARGDMYNERFGILIGGVFTDPVSINYWVEIVDMLPATRVSASSVSVEVSHNEISRLNIQVDHMLSRTQGKVRKVGWYHTHPNHGVSMSSTDLTNQRLSYPAEWHVALVVDPVRQLYAAFSGPECNPVYSSFTVIRELEAEVAESPAYLSWRTLRASILESDDL